MTSERKGWIHVAAGRCAHCDQPHAFDIEYRCVGCDREICALCVIVVHDRRERWCPACAPRDG